MTRFDNTHTESDRLAAVDTKPCPPCYDGTAKELLLFAVIVLAFALGVAMGLKIRDGQLKRQQIEETTYGH